VSWPIRTDRLLIRPVTADDAAHLWRYRQLPTRCWPWSGGRPA